jgi:hypothetical protein
MSRNTNSSGSHSSPAGNLHNQAQTAVIFCDSNRVILRLLIEEIERRLNTQAATILLHGVTIKYHDGFIVVEAARGIPITCLHWFKNDQRIIDYIVYDVPSLQQEQAAQEAGQQQQPGGEQEGNGNDA